MAHERYEEIRSTQDRALELARAGCPIGTTVRAVRQTAGRGRLEHAWASPIGGLWISIVVRTPAQHPGWLPLGVGVRVREALEARYPRGLRLKWPNDLLVPDGRGARKLGGILVDRVAGPGPGDRSVVGLGLNIAVQERDLPTSLRGTIANLELPGRRAPLLDEVEALVVPEILAVPEELDAPSGARRILAAYRETLYGMGRRAQVDGVPRGTIAGLGDDGELLLREGDDLVSIRSGDLRVEESA